MPEKRGPRPDHETLYEEGSMTIAEDEPRGEITMEEKEGQRRHVKEYVATFFMPDDDGPEQMVEGLSDEALEQAFKDKLAKGDDIDAYKRKVASIIGALPVLYENIDERDIEEARGNIEKMSLKKLDQYYGEIKDKTEQVLFEEIPELAKQVKLYEDIGRIEPGTAESVLKNLDKMDIDKAAGVYQDLKAALDDLAEEVVAERRK